ncbi:bifunctional hydroxymethylpyrimidine kinase/phosphomethylpyrimidine kinase [Streptococcus sp. CSL10205-OR2]|uniref:bifunctional hydroxymethylpyrimidine kinase/phosphomethylpyrimidine kinase n=1 Tax=Streptococcus sp. CSL10205-OR2 TaxID=2980558 RepID=UPI0021DA7957|nr:bifunctional hydroxymethylpyrimidine kinase/phosphomethylpyrimidine kinase [Streptococcus sp. CSL10205-OR2]MCU9533136.1 bifunctional hydroxymethylpyrimidine kinase/phosphomethylpyrimidine kinase [Streptococcus sp. CSL10205-OR2]
MKTNYILTIAGSDVLSGGGLQADLATFHHFHLFGFLALTSIATVSESGFEITAIDETVFQKQLDSLKDISFSAIKIGLLPNEAIAKKTLAFLKTKKDIPIILDPVLVFKENNDDEVSSMRKHLLSFFPYTTIITPNLKEAELLSGIKIATLSDMKKAAKQLHEAGAKMVVIKGGSRFNQNEAIDLFYDGENYVDLTKPLLTMNNTGAGCTFASTLSSYLAKGETPLLATRFAKDFVYQAIANANEYGVLQQDEKN